MQKIQGIISPHKKISRLVTEKDLERVYTDAEDMYKLLGQPIGLYNSFYAIAHPQCVNEDPLRFFVTNNKLVGDSWFFHNPVKTLVIINPVIVRHTNTPVESEEGCASYAFMPKTKVNRYNKCEVEYNELDFYKNADGTFKPMLSPRKRAQLSGIVAKVWQHECDHLDAKYIYDI